MMPINDNHTPDSEATFSFIDTHGRAALLLVESLIHGLCEDEILSTNQAIEIVERATSVEFDQAVAADGAGAPIWRSHALLLAISASLKIDAEDQSAATP